MVGRARILSPGQRLFVIDSEGRCGEYLIDQGNRFAGFKAGEEPPGC